MRQQVVQSILLGTPANASFLGSFNFMLIMFHEQKPFRTLVCVCVFRQVVTCVSHAHTDRPAHSLPLMLNKRPWLL